MHPPFLALVHFLPRRARFFFRLAAVVLLLPKLALADEAHRKEFEEFAKPRLMKYCVDCHKPDKAKGDLDLTKFEQYDEILKHRPLWNDIQERIFAFEMPPEGKPAPGGDTRDRLLKWLRGLPEDTLDCTKLASDRTQSFYRGHVMSRRLTRYEYENTVRDLTGISLPLALALPEDGAGGEGFDATGDTLFTSTLNLEKYLAAAEQITQAMLPSEGAEKVSAQVKAARERLLCSVPSEKTKPAEAAREILRRFCRLAFRRPPEEDELDKYMVLFQRRFDRGEGFESGLRLALRGVLLSPSFLFLAEPEPKESGVQPLDLYALASRISYFLWSTMPDEELSALAASGELAKDAVISQQVQRMLTDPRAMALGDRFAVQWLELERLGGEVTPDPKRFPEFSVALRDSMLKEVTTFFNHVIRENRPVQELLDCNYTFANQDLARLYGLPDMAGTEMRRVALPDRNRGGLLGMAGIHASTSFPLRTSPVLRGKWVMDVLLGQKVPPPPPNVPPLKEDDHKITPASLRQQLEEHRKNPDCSGCHNKMDPLGFGLEHYDVLGRFVVDGVDARGKLPSGEEFDGLPGLKDLLLKKRQGEFIHRLCEKLTGYALGRELNRFDKCIIDAATKAMRENENRPQKAIEAIILSKQFRFRFYPKSEG